MNVKQLCKASFTLSRCTHWCDPAVCSRGLGSNREGIRVRSYIPGSATNQTRFEKEEVCPGYTTFCDGAFPALPRRRYSVSRCVPIHHGSALGIGGRAPVLLRRVTEVGRQSPGVTRQHININDIFVELITYMSFASYRLQGTYQGKN